MLRIYHKLLLLLTIPLCGLITFLSGWGIYAIITERGGASGHIYTYYNMTREQFFIFSFIIIFIGNGLIFLQIKFLWNKSAKNLTRTFWGVGLFVFLVILVERWLWESKG